MADVLSRRRRRWQPARSMLASALDYAARGWPVCRGAATAAEGARACSCDRLGCPAPGAHPVSAAWGLEASVDPEVVNRWWRANPNANIILPTGRVFDVFDVPSTAGASALATMRRNRTPVGPVAALGESRYLFFVATRGAPEDESEWWQCRLDCVPETRNDTPGLRWHCRGSYVPAPPSQLPGGGRVSWIQGYRSGTPSVLPDPIVVLDVLADTCG
ncbi:bifunctional DNA primase/polymerase [Lipingzhangella sp. LS1_29]|uniref:Bifunctional DNA primase/polymerase n=1 Tax=Lipingzhangella rawalii TaxID=2055835 RepID=A0ABU2HAN8_9ACTN|nr:bifunctional DNA primase/polymerase [Lipingzhangella rawalii]MDS1271905.1 bifunctional DNA primase/polymerase [Lipingzhangella rawalii]